MRTWLISALLLMVMASPILEQTSFLDDSGEDLQFSSPIQATISPSSGWTTGGEEITITGSGFSDLAFSNTTDDGINHQWVETTMDYTDEAGRYNAIVMDSNGHIHVVHINGGNYQIRHSVYDGTSWSSVKINDCGSTYCWDVHMVIDDNDDLHVAYTTYTSWAETLVYMHYDGTTWTDELVSSNAMLGPVGIAVDSNNHPHISYAVSGQYCGDGLRIASNDGSSWTYDAVDLGSNRGCDSAMVIDENDNIYIAYQNRDESKLKIATDKSGSWDAYTVDTGTSPSNLYPGYMTSMAMDGQGQFHIAHFDEKDDDLRYSTGAPNSQWTTTIVESAGHTGRDPSIALDTSGNVHIVYNSWSGWDLKYAIYNSTTSSWDPSSISTTGDVGKGNSLFIDQNGVMHVAFSDETGDVLKYATKSTGLLQTNEIRVQFGQYGSVTGAVVNDTTIVVTTPTAGQTGDTVDLTLWDKDDNQHQLSSTFQFIDQNDFDSDGVPNVNDDCPEVVGTSTQDVNGCPDNDGDGYSNSGDVFPNDVSEWMDSDGDGVGDNADAFPNDASETSDTDDDGVGDNADAFPSNPFEQYDSDGDGVGDNSDSFPNDASETSDSDGDGVGDNSDAFPSNAFEQFDSDGDGVGDNSDAFPDDAGETIDSDGDGLGDNSDPNPMIHNFIDSDGDTVPNIDDDFPSDNTQWSDVDGDGYGDNPDGNDSDDFVNSATQWKDSDDDGFGDNWGNASWNATRSPTWPGIFVEGADTADYCPETNGNSTADGYYGCQDDDGNGIANMFEPEVENDTSSETESDDDETTQQTEESDSYLESLLSGDSGTVTKTVGFGAILIAFLTLLQTNAVAAILPDAFRWVQVLRKNSKLSKEEENELSYLQSVVQAYFADHQSLIEELRDMKADLTARYTNNQIKKETREKLFTIIDDLMTTNPDELEHIARNDVYFGLAETLDTKQRSALLKEKVSMDQSGLDPFEEEGMVTDIIPNNDVKGTVSTDGYEYLELPIGSGNWFIRNQNSGSWERWSQ